MFLITHLRPTIYQLFYLLTFFYCFADAENAILPGTNVQQLPSGVSSPVDHQSRSPLSRPALRPEASISTHNERTDREPVHLPEVPSHSPIRTETSATREKTRPLVSRNSQGSRLVWEQ